MWRKHKNKEEVRKTSPFNKKWQFLAFPSLKVTCLLYKLEYWVHSDRDQRLDVYMSSDAIISPCNPFSGVSWWLSGKESACQCKRLGFDPWVGKIPRRRKWQPTPVFLPRESHGQRNLVGYSPWGHEESDRTEQLNNRTPQAFLWFFWFLVLLPLQKWSLLIYLPHQAENCLLCLVDLFMSISLWSHGL